MKRILIYMFSIFTLSNLAFSQSDSYKDRSKCIVISKDLVKENLKYPQEASFSKSFVHEENGFGKCIVLGEVTASNAFGVKTKYTFKVWMTHNGKEWTTRNNWEMERLILEDESGEQSIVDNRKKPVNDTRKRELGYIDGIKCTFIEGNSYFTRLVTSSVLTEDQINKTAVELKIATDIIYFHLPNQTERGDEYGMKTGTLVFIFDD